MHRSTMQEIVKSSFTFKMSDQEIARLQSVLRKGNYRPIKVMHTIMAAETASCTIHVYKTGKCLVQGKGAADFVTFTLEPSVLQRVGTGYEDILNPAGIQAHMGVDESGKGDLFGPLCVAAAYVDETLASSMRKLDVKDSKNITSDKKAMAIGTALRNLLGNRFALVSIGPAAYNRLYTQMRNVNTILAWAHARAIENLLVNVPLCPRAISDQFGHKHLIEKALMKQGKKIELIQRPKAESDLAVAAASILAREAFLRALIKMKTDTGFEIPKGASEAVRTVAIQIATQKGPQQLTSLIKCHFKTTDQILSALNLDRSALGPEGQAQSRGPQAGGFKRRHTAATPPAEE